MKVVKKVIFTEEEQKTLVDFGRMICSLCEKTGYSGDDETESIAQDLAMYSYRHYLYHLSDDDDSYYYFLRNGIEVEFKNKD